MPLSVTAYPRFYYGDKNTSEVGISEGDRDELADIARFLFRFFRNETNLC